MRFDFERLDVFGVALDPRVPDPWDRARGEWALVCTCHNVRKLWVAGRAERLAATA